jgi:hypothetical protein
LLILVNFNFDFACRWDHLLLDEGLRELLALELDLWLGCVLRKGCLLHLLQLHEGVAVGSQVTDHVLLQEQVIGRSQMIVLVIFDRFQQTLTIETLLSLQVGNDFLVQQIWPLDNFEKFTRFVDNI